MYGEVKIVGRAMPMPFGCELGLKDSGVGEGELVYEMDEHVSAEAQAIETQKEQNKMKLTKEQITEKREELCKVLVAMNKQKANADNIKKGLTDDFEKNEKAYRGGVVTAAGVLYRKPRFEVAAKEKLDVGEA